MRCPRLAWPPKRLGGGMTVRSSGNAASPIISRSEVVRRGNLAELSVSAGPRSFRLHDCPSFRRFARSQTVFVQEVVRVWLRDGKREAATIHKLGKRHRNVGPGVESDALENGVAFFLQLAINARADLNSGHASEMFNMAQIVKHRRLFGRAVDSGYLCFLSRNSVVFS